MQLFAYVKDSKADNNGGAPLHAMCSYIHFSDRYFFLNPFQVLIDWEMAAWASKLIL